MAAQPEPSPAPKPEAKPAKQKKQRRKQKSENGNWEWVTIPIPKSDGTIAGNLRLLVRNTGNTTASINITDDKGNVLTTHTFGDSNP